MTIPRSAALALKLTFSLGLLVVLLLLVDIEEVRQTLSEVIPIYMVGAVFLVMCDRLLAALRTFQLLRSTGVSIRFREMLRLTWMCDFLSIFLPGSLAGDAMRIYGISRGYTSLAPAISVIALERLFGIFTLLSTAAIGALLGYITGLLSLDQFISISLIFGGSTALLAVAALMGPRILTSRFFELHALLLKFRSLLNTLFEFRSKKRTLTYTILISFGMQATRALLVMVIAIGVGIHVDAIYFLIMVPIGTLITMVPISVGGWGVQEGAYVFLMKTVGVPGSRAFVLSVLTTFAGILVALPGALIYLKFGLKKKLPELEGADWEKLS